VNPTQGSDHQERRYWGKYRGVVTDNQDPERLGRVKCRVPELLGQAIVTDWAFPTDLSYGGGQDYGKFVVPPVGSGVYVEFESGEVNRPLYGGVWYGHPKGKPADPPKLTRQDGQTKFSDDDSTKSPKGDDTLTAADCSVHNQPKSPAAPVYPHNQVLRTKENGIIVEIDDTPGKSRVHVFHGPSKSWLELDHAGELSIRIADKAYTLIEKDSRVHVKGDRHVSVDGNLTHFAKGDRWMRVNGKETKIVNGEHDAFAIGPETKVSQGGFKHFVLGDRVDVIIGNYTQYVIGRYETNVYGFYSRMAMSAIEDAAPGILHRGGAPTGTPPGFPAPPPVCG
jgi:hypothetical protein